MQQSVLGVLSHVCEDAIGQPVGGIRTVSGYDGADHLQTVGKVGAAPWPRP